MTIEAAEPWVLAHDVPLVVDVDGTLLATDLLHEAALQLAAHRPLEAIQLPLWLAKGKASLKTRLADAADPGIDSLPLREEVVALIAKFRRAEAVSDSFEMAWTRAQLELRYLGMRPGAAHRFQELASHMLYPYPRLRAADRMAAG